MSDLRGKDGVRNMTNREYMESLTDEEMAYFIYTELMRVGHMYTDSILGVAVWLGEERR